jgi:hypothetical protein
MLLAETVRLQEPMLAGPGLVETLQTVTAERASAFCERFLELRMLFLRNLSVFRIDLIAPCGWNGGQEFCEVLAPRFYVIWHGRKHSVFVAITWGCANKTSKKYGRLGASGPAERLI